MSQAIICPHGLAYANAHDLTVVTHLDLPFDSVQIETKTMEDQTNLKVVFRYQGQAMVEYPVVFLFRKDLETTITMNGMRGVLPAIVGGGS